MPQYYPHVVSFLSGDEILDLVIHVSNFQHSEGGLIEEIVFGREKDLNDMLVLFSDGLNEGVNTHNNPYGMEGVMEALKTIPRELSAEAQLEYLMDDFKRFIGSMAVKDDLTVILLKKT